MQDIHDVKLDSARAEQEVDIERRLRATEGPITRLNAIAGRER